MSDFDPKQLLADIRANSATLDACPRHLFKQDDYTFGQKMTCLHCQGRMQATDVMWYVKGYEAAGGHCDDIWPGYRTPRNKA